MTEKITRTPGICGGKARVTGHRVRVLDIALLYEHEGLSADEIAQQYPSLTLGDIHAALAYYYDNLAEMREELRQEREFAEAFRRTNPNVMGWHHAI